MFEATLNKGRVWKLIVDAIQGIIGEARWEITKERGIAMQAMDSAHVCLVSLYLSNEGFDEFRCDHNFTIGTKIESMQKILRCSGSNDTVTLKAEGIDSDCLVFSFDSSAGRHSEFEMKLMDIDSESMTIPESKFDCMVSMPSSEFSNIVKDLSTFGENVTISAAKDGIAFTSSGDIGKGTIRVSPKYDVEKEDEAVTVDLNEACTQTYTLKYLQSMAKASGLHNRVTLQLSSEQPLIVEYKIENQDIDEDLGFLRYFLAPKIDDDNEMA